MPYNPKRPHGTDLNLDGNFTLNGDFVAVGWTTLLSRLSLKRVVVPYATTVAIDCSLGNELDVSVTDSNAFAIANPLNAMDGQRITITIRNTTNSTVGAISWDTLYKLSAWISPNPGFSRSIDFRYDGTNWVEIGRTPSDVPN